MQSQEPPKSMLSENTIENPGNYSTKERARNNLSNL